jgi:CRP/FNR family transcriptional regulator, cyclic AMP receptor protein
VKPPKEQSFDVDGFLASVDGGRSISKYRPNKAIFQQGDVADSIFYVREGSVKVSVVSDQGKEAVVAIHQKGDFFGEGCLTGLPRRLATATAMTESVIMRLDKASIVSVLHVRIAAMYAIVSTPLVFRLAPIRSIDKFYSY